MKKLLLMFLSAFCIGACSVDEIETGPEDAQLLVMDATFTVNGCSLTTFDYGEAGKVEVRNDLEFVYVKILAFGNNELVKSNLHIAADISGFPTTGNGGINLNKMDYQLSFDKGIKEYTYKFPINSFGDSFLVGAFTEFQLGKKKYGYWAGDFSGHQWFYFGYDLFDHPNAGADNSDEISLSAARAIPSWDETRKLFTAMLDPGVPEGQFVGTFEPSIWEIIDKFNSPSGGVGEYSTVYTIGEGDCTDSVELTLKILDDQI